MLTYVVRALIGSAVLVLLMKLAGVPIFNPFEHQKHYEEVQAALEEAEHESYDADDYDGDGYDDYDSGYEYEDYDYDY